MAKKGSRVLIGLTCGECDAQNYVLEKNKVNTPSSLTLKKYCSKCNKRTVHKEKKKLG
ncbi:50S ribosomal protein L33 [Candidatus Roizmanbacteria bacterium CG09_land_8_20_14_0_10_41_9]|uniref:Large ribosomal subunit protein bL33 n=1 Tax=Candidatus Roizmanbacteria bacterium CG09_land_8_20_14_0_10_41_9 TaxID=1974850 RepID=A0A2H0WTM6_9BACT|nr:MAG: 50S ribosomal protein L33 [Candidatus Roizmanbacteria bacterium CG09_land_8_20_14_0_10_41_9]